MTDTASSAQVGVLQDRWDGGRARATAAARPAGSSACRRSPPPPPPTWRPSTRRTCGRCRCPELLVREHRERRARARCPMGTVRSANRNVILRLSKKSLRREDVAGTGRSPRRCSAAPGTAGCGRSRGTRCARAARRRRRRRSRSDGISEQVARAHASAAAERGHAGEHVVASRQLRGSVARARGIEHVQRRSRRRRGAPARPRRRRLACVDWRTITSCCRRGGTRRGARGRATRPPRPWPATPSGAGEPQVLGAHADHHVVEPAASTASRELGGQRHAPARELDDQARRRRGRRGR